MDADLADRLAEFRSLRHELEAQVLAIASSTDGRVFELQAPIDALYLQTGGYVALDSADGTRLGQILALEVERVEAGELGWDASGIRTHVTIRGLRGTGSLLDGDGSPFLDASVRPADASELRDWITRSGSTRARLTVGEMTSAPGLTHALDASGFDRHTFLCGQSGSGKTYALGVLLERLLVETSLRIVILDPNSDFVRLAEVRAGVPADDAERHRAAARDVVVHGAGAAGAARLRLHLGELAGASAAAALRLDPLGDDEEYDAFTAVMASAGPDSMPDLAALDGPGGAALTRRARNL